MIEKVDFAFGEIEDYIHLGENRPADYADRIGVSVGKFLNMVTLFKGKKLEEERAEEAKREENAKRQMTRISEEQKSELYNAAKKGATRTALGERFGIAQSTVHNIIKKQRVLEAMRKDKAKAEKKAPVLKEVTQPVESFDLKDFVPEAKSDIGIEFEGDYLVLRVNKRHVTRTLLAGLL